MYTPLFLIRFSLSLVLFFPALLFAASTSRPVFGFFEMKRLQESEKPMPPAASEVIPENNRADNPKAWKKRGMTRFREGRYQDALFAFNQAISLKEDDPEAWNYKGEALFNLARKEEALAAFKTALKIRPLLTRAMHNKGAVLLDLGRLKKALAVYELLIRRNPSDAKAWKEQAEVLFRLGRHFEALDAVMQALDLRPGFQDAEKLKQKLDAKIQNLRFNL